MSGLRRPSAAARATLREALAFALAALGPLTLYVLTLPRTVVLEDDGLFLMAAAHLGIAHPPGYPLHTWIAHLFLQLPFGSPAFLGHLSSAVLGALACGCVYLCARRLGAASVAALAAAWLFGASEQFWAQAIITEVYTLNALLFFAACAAVLQGPRSAGRRWPWFVAAAAAGLSFANHWPLMALSAPGLALLALPAWREWLPRLPALAATFAVSAAAPYGWLVWRSQQAPTVSFYGEIASLRDLWFYVSRQGYSHVDASPAAGWADRLSYAQWFGNELLWQFTLPGFALAALGVYARLAGKRLAPKPARPGQSAKASKRLKAVPASRRGTRRRRWNVPAVALGTLMILLGNSAALIVLLGFDFDHFQVAVFRPYSLVGYGIVALWLAVGLQFLAARLPRLLPVAGRLPGVATAVVAVVGLALTAASTHASWPKNNRAESDIAQAFVELTFGMLPENAVLLVSGDMETGPFGYFHFVEEHRPDISLISIQGLVYGNRLYSPLAPEETRHQGLSEYIDSVIGERRVFSHGPFDMLDARGIVHHGHLIEIAPDVARGQIRIEPNDASDEWFETQLARRTEDTWERRFRDLDVYGYGQYLGTIVFSRDPGLMEETARVRELAEGQFYSNMGMLETLLNQGTEHLEDPQYLDYVRKLLEQGQELMPAELSKERRSRFLYMQGFTAATIGQEDEGVALLRESWEIYPHPNNSARTALETLGAWETLP